MQINLLNLMDEKACYDLLRQLRWADGDNPLIFQARYKKTRQAPVKDFPMQVHYLVEKAKRVVVLAVLHAARDPQVWKNRS
ncbi:MAG: hypothetical protein WA004_19470 [Saprospiraceae bacterium]